jgi:hypothetical protein
MKLISEKKVNGNTVTVYRYPLLADHRISVKNAHSIDGHLAMEAIPQIGYEDFEVVTDANGKKISEIKLKTKIYDERG